MQIDNRVILAATAAASLLSLVAIARTTIPGVGMVSHREAPTVIKEALAKNPEIILQAVKQAREKQANEGKKDIREAFGKYRAELFTDMSSPAVGSADADVTIIEFFDYHCGYCKKMLPTFSQLVQEDKKVRVIFREFPILSEDSILAARAALAFNNLNKERYFEYHTAIMNMRGKYTEQNLGAKAQRLGVTPEALLAEMQKPEITAILEKNRKIADDFGIRGTPALIIGDQMMPGAISYADLKKVVADTRAAKPTK